MKTLTDAQRRVMLEITGMPRCLLLADVGSGKTAIAGFATKPRLPALVVAPKRVCLEVWAGEFKDWRTLENTTVAHWKPGAHVPNVDYLTVSYESLPRMMREYPEGPVAMAGGLHMSPYRTIILDEVDKMKSSSSLRFKGAGKPQPGLRDWIKNFDFVLAMTGTPTPNHLLDIWGAARLVDGGAALGRDYEMFKRKYFWQADWLGYDWQAHEESPKRVQKKIAPFTVRFERPAGSGIPPVVELPPRHVDMPAPRLKEYRRLEKKYITAFGDGGDAEADNAAHLYGKLRQFAQGFMYNVEATAAGTQFTKPLHEAKFPELDSLVGELMGQQLLVVYHHRWMAGALEQRYGDRLAVLGGGMAASTASRVIQYWNTGRLPILAMQPQTAGHGLNLQHSNAAHVCFLTPVETAGLYTQAVGRLARMGNAADRVLVHRILCRGTLDEEVDARMRGKIRDQEDFLNRIKRRYA